MITSSTIVYTVANGALGVRVNVDSEEKANLIDQNLDKTEEFVRVLEKYYDLPHWEKKTDDYFQMQRAVYMFTEDGEFDGINIMTKRIDYNVTDDGSSANKNHNERITKEEFYKYHLHHVLKDIDIHIAACSSLLNQTMLPRTIINLAKKEIENYRNDLNVLISYSGVTA